MMLNISKNDLIPFGRRVSNQIHEDEDELE